eukprot:m.49923 g.49923  ORF g.49923 m.49923 type:complete len:370 (-) comp12512_c0_seq1:59-1168(-)
MAESTHLALSRVRWSLDEACFAVATDNGFWVYNSDPTTLIKKQDLGGGVEIAQLLNRTNIVLLVGGGERPIDAPNRVCVWDDIKGKIIHRIELKSRILNILVKKTRLVVVLQEEVCVYDFPGSPLPTLLHTYETCPNPRGLATLASSPSSNVLVTLGLHSNDAYIVDIGDTPKQGPTMCTCHKHEITQMVIDAKGQLLATTSLRGTIIRLYEAKRGELVREFRRGYTPSVLTSLRFSRDSVLLCATSDRSVHIYHVQKPELNTTTSLGFMPGFSKESSRFRSFVSFDSVTACVCCFDRKGAGVIAVCDNGLARKMKFDAAGKPDPQHQIVQLLKYNTGHLFRVDMDKWRQAHRGYVPPSTQQADSQPDS